MIPIHTTKFYIDCKANKLAGVHGAEPYTRNATKYPPSPRTRGGTLKNSRNTESIRHLYTPGSSEPQLEHDHGLPSPVASTSPSPILAFSQVAQLTPKPVSSASKPADQSLKEIPERNPYERDEVEGTRVLGQIPSAGQHINKQWKSQYCGSIESSQVPGSKNATRIRSERRKRSKARKLAAKQSQLSEQQKYGENILRGGGNATHHSAALLGGPMNLYTLTESPDRENEDGTFQNITAESLSPLNSSKHDEKKDDDERDADNHDHVEVNIAELDKQLSTDKMVAEPAPRPVTSPNKRKRSLSAAIRHVTVESSCNTVDTLNSSENRARKKRVIHDMNEIASHHVRQNNDSTQDMDVDMLPSSILVAQCRPILNSSPTSKQKPGILVRDVELPPSIRSCASPTPPTRYCSPELGDISLITPSIVSAAMLRPRIREASLEIPESVYGSDDWAIQSGEAGQNSSTMFRSDLEIVAEAGSEPNVLVEISGEHISDASTQVALDTQILSSLKEAEDHETLPGDKKVRQNTMTSSEGDDCDVARETVEQNYLDGLNCSYPKRLNEEAPVEPESDDGSLNDSPTPSIQQKPTSFVRTSPSKERLSPMVVIVTSSRGTEYEKNSHADHIEGQERAEPITDFALHLDTSEPEPEPEPESEPGPGPGPEPELEPGQTEAAPVNVIMHATASNTPNETTRNATQGFYHPMICQVL
jgi:hypothetical protein